MSHKKLSQNWLKESYLVLWLLQQCLLRLLEKGKKSHTCSHSQVHYSDCKFCGCSHDKGQCPAFGKRCNSCGGKNHFESKCTQKSSSRTSDRKRSDRTRCMHKCNVHEIHKECQGDNSIEHLMEKVQSPFYLWKLNWLPDESLKWIGIIETELKFLVYYCLSHGVDRPITLCIISCLMVKYRTIC